MRRPLTPVLAAAAVAACVDAAAPTRLSPYAYGIPIDTSFTAVFRWPAASLPVRIWAQPANDLPYHVSLAIAEWERNALYGEFRGILVADSSSADVVVTTGLDFSPVRSDDEIACAGATFLSAGLDSVIDLPFRTRIDARVDFAPDSVRSCFTIVTTHELGHSLGLFLNSPDSADLMYGRPTTAQLSPRDRATFLALYHSTPNIRLPRGR